MWKAYGILVVDFVLGLQSNTWALDFTNSMSIQSQTRRFITHIPDQYDGTWDYPILFMFHGHESSADAAASSYYKWKPIADSNHFIVVFPDAITPPPKNIEWPAGNILFESYDLTGKRWDMAHVLAPDRTTSQDIDFTEAILDWLIGNYAVRTSHVFTTGHSYGALFSYYVAVCLSNKVTAFSEHSGGLLKYELIPDIWNIWWPIDVPASNVTFNGILVHSTGDATVGYTNSTLLYEQMQTNHHTAQLITLPAPFGHDWDSTYNQAQWDFFLSHSSMIDDDEDNIPDTWEIIHGLSVYTNDAMNDPDNDQMSNYSEYVSGTDPQDAASALQVTTLHQPLTDQISIHWQSVSGRAYSIDYAKNPLSSFSNVISGLLAQDMVMSFTNPTSSALGIYRVQTP